MRIVIFDIEGTIFDVNGTPIQKTIDIIKSYSISNTIIILMSTIQCLLSDNRLVDKLIELDIAYDRLWEWDGYCSDIEVGSYIVNKIKSELSSDFMDCIMGIYVKNDSDTKEINKLGIPTHKLGWS